MNKKPCTRCLLKDFDKDEYFKSIYEYIESIPEDIKSPDDLYKKRLDACKLCDDLVNGMCKKCGCFVEVRAIKITNHCAKSVEVW